MQSVGSSEIGEGNNADTIKLAPEWLPSDVPCDTQLLIVHIQSMAESCHGFVFQHQLYANDINQSIIDEELHRIRCQVGQYKFLSCRFTQSAHNSLAIIETDSYVASLRKVIRPLDNGPEEQYAQAEAALLCEKFSSWIRQSTQISMLRRDLKSGAAQQLPSRELGTGGLATQSAVSSHGVLTDRDIDRLVQAGFLQYRSSIDMPNESVCGDTSANEDSELFWLSHPSLRSLIQCLESSQVEILGVMRQNRYKEISEKKLQVRVSPLNQHRTAGLGGGKRLREGRNHWVLSSSPFPLSYHLMDLLGRGVLYRVPAPATDDYILRIKT